MINLYELWEAVYFEIKREFDITTAQKFKEEMLELVPVNAATSLYLLAGCENIALRYLSRDAFNLTRNRLLEIKPFTRNKIGSDEKKLKLKAWLVRTKDGTLAIFHNRKPKRLDDGCWSSGQIGDWTLLEDNDSVGNDLGWEDEPRELRLEVKLPIGAMEK